MRIMKILKTIEIRAIIKKIAKTIQNPCENHENNTNQRISFENHEDHEDLRNPYENY